MGLSGEEGGSRVLDPGSRSLAGRAFQQEEERGCAAESFSACKNYLHLLDGSGSQLVLSHINSPFCSVCINVIDCYAHCQLFLILTSQLPVFCYLISILTI